MAGFLFVGAFWVCLLSQTRREFYALKFAERAADFHTKWNYYVMVPPDFNYPVGLLYVFFFSLIFYRCSHVNIFFRLIWLESFAIISVDCSLSLVMNKTKLLGTILWFSHTLTLDSMMVLLNKKSIKFFSFLMKNWVYSKSRGVIYFLFKFNEKDWAISYKKWNLWT